MQMYNISSIQRIKVNNFQHDHKEKNDYTPCYDSHLPLPGFAI